MFGVTTPCVDHARARLTDLGYEVLVFHMTGVGGRTLESLATSGHLAGVLDVTTTELADELLGGVFSAGPERLTAAGRAGIPQVVSVGALDMVNFGPRDTVPREFEGRNLFVHNPSVTLMRTTPEECAELGTRLAERLSAATGPTTLFLPLRGISAIAVEGGPFHDPAADDALFEAIRSRLDRSVVDLVELDAAVNDPAFAEAMADRLHEYLTRRRAEMPRIDRESVLERLRAKRDRAELIVGGGAGTGLSAKCEEAGGIDLIVIYNSGRYRMAGRGSLAGLLAYGNANDIVVEMAREVLPVVRDTPVLAGVNGTDPFYQPEVFLPRLAELGFSGVQNFPTVGLIDGTFRANLEETGMGFKEEVAMIAAAHRLGLLTTPYVFSTDDAEAMTEAGADIIVTHLGLTTGGSIGAGTARTLDESTVLIEEWAAAARAVRSDVLVLCHGGPIAEPEDVRYVLERCPSVDGFYGASSMERLPAERAITATTQAFTDLRTKPRGR